MESALEGEPRAGGINCVGGCLGRIDDLDQVQSDLRGVAEVLKRKRRLLEGDEHAGGRAIGVRDRVSERLPRPLHGLPERLEFPRFRPAQVGPLELELARADADVIALLLFGVERSKAVDDHWVLDGEAERVLCGEREGLAGVDHRRDGDAADGVGHGLRDRKMSEYSARGETDFYFFWVDIVCLVRVDSVRIQNARGRSRIVNVELAGSR